jgi:hypothetical protein
MKRAQSQDRKRLKQIEELFVSGQFENARTECWNWLQSLSEPNNSYLSHQCPFVDGVSPSCICTKLIPIYSQILFEQGKSNDVLPFIENWYSPSVAPPFWPFPVFYVL